MDGELAVLWSSGLQARRFRVKVQKLTMPLLVLDPLQPYFSGYQYRDDDVLAV